MSITKFSAFVNKDDALIASYNTYGITCNKVGDVIPDNSGNGYDISYVKIWTDVDEKEPVSDYAYAFAVVGDTQTLTNAHHDELVGLYDWIVKNKDEKKIEFVFGMGDITQNNKGDDAEFTFAKEQIDKLNGVVPYSLVRGNHDTIEHYNKYFADSEFAKSLEGKYAENDVRNAYKTFEVGATKFLVLMLDYMPTNAALNWAAGVIEAHPDHKVIVTTHSYLSKNGSLTVATLGDRNDGERIWQKFVSQHKNIFLVLSGHICSEFVVSTQTKGIHGNTVTQFLVNSQRVDVYEQPATGMVALLYISNDGKTLHVEQYSTKYNKYYMSSSQYSLDLPEPICYEHNYGSELSYDSESHYYLCDCGAMKDKTEHSGGTATCTEKAECEVCGASYGELAHTGGEATCLAKAKCESCGEEYGSYANHNCVFDSFSGRFVCTVCQKYCEHTSFTDGACDSCGLVCVHDWVQRDSVSVCTVCEKTCSVHDTKGLDFKCAYCGYDKGWSNSFSSGSSGGQTITDGALLLNKQHKFTVSFNATVGSTDTVLNQKTDRKDDVYYSTEGASINSDYFSLFTWHNNTGYDTLVSLWLDTEETKLYLVGDADKTARICEIELGAEYSFDFELYPASGIYDLVVYNKDGEKCGSYSGNFGAMPDKLTISELRFGEKSGKKRLRVEKIRFTDTSVGYPSYENGTCIDCGVECTHIFNAGGHCIFCGELGDVITFYDGQNGGGNVTATGKNGSPFTDKNDGVYRAEYKAYKQVWDYRDVDGMLLDKDYVFGGKFTFTSCDYISSAKGTSTRFLSWVDGEVNYDLGYENFALYLLTNTVDEEGNPVLDISLHRYGDTGRYTLELNKEYDIRVVIRYVGGTTTHSAEVYINRNLIWEKGFNLTGANGISIRMGDHIARKSRARFTVSDDFGIRSIGDGISFIGTQSEINANFDYDPTFDLRFIFGLDDIYLKDVGVKVEASVTGGEILDDADGELTCSSSRKVYTNVMADGKVYQPGACGVGYGGYYLALVVKDIWLDTSATYSFVVTPYMERHNGETIFSEISYNITVTFENGQIKISY